MQAALFLSVACLPETSMTDDAPPGGGSPPPAALSYAETVMVPSACYAVERPGTRIERGDTLAIQHVLRAEPGFCAQVVTPREVSGVVENAAGFDRVVLEIVDETGAVTQSIVLRGE